MTTTCSRILHSGLGFLEQHFGLSVGYKNMFYRLIFLRTKLFRFRDSAWLCNWLHDKKWNWARCGRHSDVSFWNYRACLQDTLRCHWRAKICKISLPKYIHRYTAVPKIDNSRKKSPWVALNLDIINSDFIFVNFWCQGLFITFKSNFLSLKWKCTDKIFFFRSVSQWFTFCRRLWVLLVFLFQ